VNLFNEIKPQIQEVLKQDANLKSADVEIQQRTIEYLQLSQIADMDVLATVLEEMPSFAERESSILSSILQKKKPPSEAGGGAAAAATVKEEKPQTHHLNGASTNGGGTESKQNGHNGDAKQIINHSQHQHHYPTTTTATANNSTSIPNSQSIDLLGLNFSPPSVTPASKIQQSKSDQEALLDIFGGPVPPIVNTTNLTHSTSSSQSANNNFGSLFSFDGNDNNGLTGTPTNGNIPSPFGGAVNTFTPINSITSNHMQFLFKNNDTIFENQSIHIEIKSEYKQNLGRLVIVFTNKSSFMYQSFSVEPSVSSPPGENELLRLVLKPPESTFIQPSSQLQQLVNVECVNDFQHFPQVTVQFRYLEKKNFSNRVIYRIKAFKLESNLKKFKSNLSLTLGFFQSFSFIPKKV
jgi:hypothetical protein